MPFILCHRCQKSGDPITAEIPWDEITVQKIRSHICSTCWNEWEEQAIIVINELSLKLFLPADRSKLEVAMREFLQI